MASGCYVSYSFVVVCRYLYIDRLKPGWCLETGWRLEPDGVWSRYKVLNYRRRTHDDGIESVRLAHLNATC